MPALDDAGPGLSLVASGLGFVAKSCGVCGVLMVFLFFRDVFRFYCLKRDLGCDPLCRRAAVLCFLLSNTRKLQHHRFLPFFCCAFAGRVLCFNPGEGSTIIYHLVAATVPGDRRQAEERHPR